MKDLFRNVAFWGVVVVTLLTSLPVWAQTTQTITLKSGTGGAEGSQDPANQFTPDGGTTWQDAFVICPPYPPSNICMGAYNQIPGTQWISRAFPYGQGAPEFASTPYRITFTLPAGFMAPSITVQVYADNVATIFLNGTQIGQQPFGEYSSNFAGPYPWGPPWSYTATEQSLFSAGVNFLTFEIYNFCCGTGFDYKAIVSFTTVLPVEIDIMPDRIKLTSKGKIPVAILSTNEFNAPEMVDWDTLTFGREGSEDSLAFCDRNSQDVNGDGLMDLVCHFYTQKTDLQCTDTAGILIGKTVKGTPIEGSDSVNIVPCN
jgi:hypothetical protein